jgi:methionyl-tRNA formyltransferase
VRIVFMGSPEFVVPVLNLLRLSGQTITAVYTRPDKPAGRGREILAPPVKTAALKMGLSVLQPADFKAGETVEQLRSLRPEAIVVAAYGLILPQTVLASAPFGCINIHPSLLPKYRGPSPVVASLLAGDEFAGVSVMQLDAGMDSGPLFCRAQIPVLDCADAVSLTAELFLIGGQLVLEVLARLGQGKIVPLTQDSTQATFTREITREDGKIDWRSTAVEIWRQVRAYQPWPQAYSYWRGKQVKIIEALPLPEAEQSVPGLVGAQSANQEIVIGTGRGLLAVQKLQIEGKKAMSAAEFLRGQRDFSGSCLEF